MKVLGRVELVRLCGNILFSILQRGRTKRKWLIGLMVLFDMMCGTKYFYHLNELKLIIIMVVSPKMYEICISSCLKYDFNKKLHTFSKAHIFHQNTPSAALSCFRTYCHPPVTKFVLRVNRFFFS